MGLSADETSNEELARLPDESTTTCPEEILRIFVTRALDQLSHPLVENLPMSHKKAGER